ncbi:beta-lactamase/transpeptidase-like protein [Hypoxylon crocopeplum]|nr:beta-lactamase/transpeptidase-like protein [Hypoxylon crocopeplum]
MQNTDEIYEQAVASGLIPGYSLLAGDADGNLLYSKSGGRASLKEGDDRQFTQSTICAVASMTKLMTSIAVLQAVEDGVLDLDSGVRPLLPRIGEYGIIKHFDVERNEAVLETDSSTITTRMLLSHTSGHEYDALNPLLANWRASRGEEPGTGPTVEHRCVLPLMSAPGTGFAYGAGHDWAGKVVEITTKSTLDDFMRERIWKPLGIENDTSFYPKTQDAMKNRIAGIATLGEKGEPPAVDAGFFDNPFGGTDCFGGSGLYTSARAYHTFLSAILKRDPKLLKRESYEELFRPQLDEKCEQALNDYVSLSPRHTQLLAMRIPSPIRKSWSFAGMIAKEGREGRFGAGTVFWGGVPCTQWFIDHENGIHGAAVCQVIPPLHPAVIALHEEFQRGVLEQVKR